MPNHKHNQKYDRIMSVLIPLLLAGSSAHADSPSPELKTHFQRGMDCLSSRNYPFAEAYLKLAVLEDPRNPIVHYHYANSLVYVKRSADAVQEYSQCYKLDPFGPASGYCRKALMTYGVQVPEPEDAEPVSALERMGQKPNPVKSKEEAARPAISTLHDQAEREKSRHRILASATTHNILSTGENNARLVHEKASQAIDKLLNEPVLAPPGMNKFQMAEYTRLQVEQVRKDAEEAAKLELARAAEKSEAYKNWSKQREDQVDETVSNLEHQLKIKTLAGSARLRQEGTGLFVRYYGADSGPIPDVHTGVARIVESQVPLHSVARSKTEDTPAATSTVRGAVLK